ILVGIADVDALVPKGSVIDEHAASVTTSLYTGVAVFPMLPEGLSTDLTSLNEGVDRLAIVIEMHAAKSGDRARLAVYPAPLPNHARLPYDEVSAWLGGGGRPPARVMATPGLEEQLRLQDEAARALKKHRHERGALDLETIEARPVARDGRVVDLELTRK